jgi:hypothetical protein
MMRFYSTILVVIVVRLHLVSVSGFTSYAVISNKMKIKGLQVDYLIDGTMIELKRGRPSSTKLHESSNKKKGGLDESVRTKLVSESIAPWRTLRLFLYFSLGSGALVGGLITLTGFAAVVSGAKEGNINTEVRNLLMCMASIFSLCLSILLNFSSKFLLVCLLL